MLGNLDPNVLPESQCDRSTMDMMFSLMQIQENALNKICLSTLFLLISPKPMIPCQEKDYVLCRGSMVVQEKIVNLVECLHSGVQAYVAYGGSISKEEFAASNGVKQGCVLSPTLFFTDLPARSDL